MIDLEKKLYFFENEKSKFSPSLDLFKLKGSYPKKEELKNENTGPYLDYIWLKKPFIKKANFKSHKGAFSIKVYDQPGLWMSDKELKNLSVDLVKVAKSSMAKLPDYNMFAGCRKALRNRIVAIAYDNKSGKPAAFTAMVYLPFVENHVAKMVIHLGLTMISEDYRGKRLQTPLFKRAFVIPMINQRRIRFDVTNIAASPAGIGATSDYFQDVYPSYHGRVELNHRHQLIASQILRNFRHEFGCSLDAEFNHETFVVKGSNHSNGGGAYQFIKQDAVSRYRKEECNQFCDRVLDYPNGDELFQVGEADFILGMFRARSSNRLVKK